MITCSWLWDAVFVDAVFVDAVFGDAVFGDAVFGDAVFGDAVFSDAVYCNALSDSLWWLEEERKKHLLVLNGKNTNIWKIQTSEKYKFLNKLLKITLKLKVSYLEMLALCPNGIICCPLFTSYHLLGMSRHPWCYLSPLLTWLTVGQYRFAQSRLSIINHPNITQGLIGHVAHDKKRTRPGNVAKN